MSRIRALAAAIVMLPAIARAHDSTSPACLTPATRDVLRAAEAHFGREFKLVSTCRPGAVIAGTRRASQHRYGRAVDLLVPRDLSKAAVARWLYAHARGVVMTYYNMPQIHFDTGPYHAMVWRADAYGGRRLAHRGRHHRFARTEFSTGGPMQ